MESAFEELTDVGQTKGHVTLLGIASLGVLASFIVFVLEIVVFSSIKSCNIKRYVNGLYN